MGEILRIQMDGCAFVHIETCEDGTLVVLYPFHFVYQCSSFEGISIELSIGESGFSMATVEKEALCLLLLESPGISSRVVAVVCPWKVQEARLKQSVI